MTAEIFFRYLHFITLFALFGALVSEHLLLKDQMTPREIRRLSIIDAIYGLAALVTIGAGLMLWLGVGNIAEFYTKNGIFHLKLGLVILLAILSIAPTLFFLKNRKSNHPDQLITVPKYVKMLIRMELLLLLIIPLCAVLMAKGQGYFG